MADTRHIREFRAGDAGARALRGGGEVEMKTIALLGIGCLLVIGVLGVRGTIPFGASVLAQILITISILVCIRASRD